MNQELMDMAVKVGIEFTNDPTENPMTTFAECWIEELEAFATLVAAAERADMRKGFAGVMLWLGDAQVTQLVTETQIKYERNQGDALTLAAQKCLEIYAGARGDTK
jgi:hypothetical protein